MYTIKDMLTFGQYKGLLIQEVYQGTLNIDRKLVADYLYNILNNKPDYHLGFEELKFIERFDVDTQTIKIIGQIFNEEKPLTEDNRIIFGNLEGKMSEYINAFWENKNLGIFKNIKLFAKENNSVSPLGGDPEYLIWCENNIDGFQLEEGTKKSLEKLTICRFKGINVIYKTANEYEYREIVEYDKFRFGN